MSHLGPLISPLADGQLPLARAERAFAHVAGCDECRRALDAERASRAAARAAGEVRASPDLTARLLALQMPDVPLSGPSFPALASGAEPMRVTGWSEREHHPLRTRVMTGKEDPRRLMLKRRLRPRGNPLTLARSLKMFPAR